MTEPRPAPVDVLPPRRPASRRPNENRAPRPEDLWRPARELPDPSPCGPWTTPPR